MRGEEEPEHWVVTTYGELIVACDYHYIDDLYCEDYQGQTAFLFDKLNSAFAYVFADPYMENATGVVALVETGFCVEIELDDG